MDATLKETNIWRSVKKFWLDELPEIKIFFDNIVVTPTFPDVDNWIVIKVEGLTPEQVSYAFMTIFMFSRKDAEGDDLVALRDEVINALFPGFINLYDTSESPWTKIGGILVQDITQSRTVPSPGSSRMRYIESTLRWGAVW